MDHIPPDTDTLLSLRGLGLSYRALPALRAIDFTLRAGEHWACLGPNGAGKTSLARVISGQATHFTGAMQRAPALTRRGIAYVCFEQARALCARDHKLDDAEFRADARDPGTTVEALLQRARPAPGQRRHWARRLGIDHLSARGVRYLSTGELRRTLLAAALLAQPALLILDNPLDGLDRDAQEALRRILDELTGSDTALLMLCRQPDDIPPGVTHVLVLDGGGSVTSGPRREVLDDARVTALLAPPHRRARCRKLRSAPTRHRLPARCSPCATSRSTTGDSKCCGRSTGCSSAACTAAWRVPTAAAKPHC